MKRKISQSTHIRLMGFLNGVLFISENLIFDIMGRLGLSDHVCISRGWEGISSVYRDRLGCIIYISKDKQDIYVDVPGEEATLCSDDSKSGGVSYYKFTPLHYMIVKYLEITKVWLRNNKQARRWLNRFIKNNFIYSGKLFKEYFLPSGEINWDLVINDSVVNDLDDLKSTLFGEGINWCGYNPLRNKKS